MVLESAKQVIAALGGKKEVQRLTGRKSVQVVDHWLSDNRLPANTFPKITEELAKRGLSAKLRAWGIKS